jgi:hypothetical protein
MKRIAVLGFALVFAGALAGQAFADKPSWAGGGDRQEKGNGKGKGKGNSRDGDKGGGSYVRGGSVVFTDQHRVVIRDYYTSEFRGGHCPPGLAKKNNGCMPPGQAKKWRVGHAIPGDVIYYDLPPALVVKLGTPPAGHKFVRVAADILLIAVGTGMVVSAIEDLGRL